MNKVKRWNAPKGATIQEVDNGEFVLAGDFDGEIAKRDAIIYAERIDADLQRQELDAANGNLAGMRAELSAAKETISRYETTAENCDLLRGELAAIKAQEPVAVCRDGYGTIDWYRVASGGTKFYAAPVSEAKEQGEYGDAYQGAREDLAIWKRRALEAEKALQEERIITERLGNALNEENGPTFMGEPVFPAKAKGVVMPERDAVIRKAVGMCNRIPGSTTWNAAEFAYDELADRLNAAPVQQVSVPDGWKLVPVNATEAILDVLYSNGIDESDSLLQDIWSAMLANAPSPAGVDGLEVVAWQDAENPLYTTAERRVMHEWAGNQYPIVELCRLSDAQAIIDGLRGEVAEQEETANHWRDLALQFDRHRMAAMAHIRAAASGDKSAIEALGVFAALPPIPGHEITTERDQLLAQRDQLAGLLRDVRKGVHWQIIANRIDTALSELPQ